MPKTKEQFEAMRKATEQKIAEAALLLFAKKGFANTSIQDIADFAGISVGLIYRHFSSKDDLFAGIIRMSSTGAADNLRYFNEMLSPAQVFKTLSHDLCSESNSEDFYTGWLLISQAILNETVKPEIESLLENNHRVIKEAITTVKRGQKLGQMQSGDPKELVYLFFSALQGMAMVKYLFLDDFADPDPNLVARIIVKEEYL